jgi:hypothetical protein
MTTLRPLMVALSMLSLAACADGTGMHEVSDGGHDGATDAGPADVQCGACPTWTVRCGYVCVDLTSSPDNCGACGVACDPSETCSGGVCMRAPHCTPMSAADGGTSTGSETGTTTGLRAEYYADVGLASVAVVRTDATVNFDWSMMPPAPGMANTNFSVQWTGQVTAPVDGSYTFYTSSDDGVRLWVNNRLRRRRNDHAGGRTALRHRAPVLPGCRRRGHPARVAASARIACDRTDDGADPHDGLRVRVLERLLLRHRQRTADVLLARLALRQQRAVPRLLPRG